MQVAINETCKRRQWSQTKDKGRLNQYQRERHSYIEMHVTNWGFVSKVSNCACEKEAIANM
jgi:hypothetical protein